MESRELLGLVKSALDAVESPSVRSSSLVRRAIRIAMAHRDYGQVMRFAMETGGVGAGKLPPGNVAVRAYESLAALIGDKAANAAISDIMQVFFTGRAMPSDGPDKGKISGFDITRLEENVELLQATLEQLRSQQNAGDSFNAILTSLQAQRSILTRVRQESFDYFLRVEDELEQGQEESSVLQRGKEYVDVTLTRESPGTLRRLKAAERRLSRADRDSENLSLALTGCRRTLHSLADFVYPATNVEIKGPDGKKRKMTDDLYINRILQFVSDQLGKHKQGPVVQESLNDLGNRLGGLNSLSSKGVHGEVNRDEAESCVVWTYLAVADVLRIWDGSRLGNKPAII